MNADQILTDVFADRADLRPDASDVLSEVQQRLARRRRVPVARTAAVLGTAAAVAATAVTAAAVAGRDGHSSGHHTAAAVDVTGTHSTAPASTHGNPAATQPSANHGYSTIAAGWLPGAGREVGASTQPGFEQRDYDVSVDGVDMDVIIYLEDGSQLPTRTEAGSGDRDITINGHPGREFIADNATIVAFNLGNGKIAYAGPSVVATSGQVSTARITDIAVHVAREIQFNRHDPITSDDGLHPAHIPG